MIINFLNGSTQEIAVPDLVGLNRDGVAWEGVVFEGKDIRHASFRGANLRNAVSVECNLSGSNFIDAKLMNTWFLRARIQRSNLSGGWLMGARCDEACLVQACLQGADVWGASFEMANISGCNMLCRRITEAKFHGARYDRDTLWPIDFDPVAAGAILVP